MRVFGCTLSHKQFKYFDRTGHCYTCTIAFKWEGNWRYHEVSISTKIKIKIIIDIDFECKSQGKHMIPTNAVSYLVMFPSNSRIVYQPAQYIQPLWIWVYPYPPRTKISLALLTSSISWEFLDISLFRIFSVCCFSCVPMPFPSTTGRN